EGCSVGKLLPLVVSTTITMLSLPVTNILTFIFFPCTGAAYNCKPPQTQINELVDFINKNKVLVQTIWIDFEIDKTTWINNWSKDPASNLALAKQFTEAAKATSLNYWTM
ncbi:30208_t:CDS:1, partial [Gigaspora margarita]